MKSPVTGVWHEALICYLTPAGSGLCHATQRERLYTRLRVSFSSPRSQQKLRMRLYRLVERTVLGVSGQLVGVAQACRTVFDQGSWLSSLPQGSVALYVLGRFKQAQ